MVDQVRIDHVLQIPAAVVRKEDIDCFGGGVALVRRDAIIDGRDDVRVRIKERVSFYFLEGEGDGFLAEGAAYLLEGEELLVRVILDEVDVGEAALDEPIRQRSHRRMKLAWLTSPSNRCILKLRLLILSCGDPGKHTMQFVNEYTTSRKYDPNDPILTAVTGW